MKPAEPEKKKVRDVVLESGITVKPVYGPDDLKCVDFARDIGKPGEFPFTRGIHSLMFRAQPWTMRQYAGFGTPTETNRRFKYLISHGQNALNVAFDLPSQNGLDSDDPRAEGEVGRVGMPVDTLDDMETAFDGIPIDKVSVSLTINSMATVMLAMYLAVAERRNIPRDQVRGTLQNDILKEYIGRGTWIYPVEPSIKLIVDTIEFCAKELPRYNPLSVCGYHIRESGATPAQEMAYALLIAETYGRRAIERGLKPDEFLSRFSFNFDIHGNLWEQVAKFRAGRRMWARIAKESLGATDPKSMMLRMIAGGGGGGLTIEEPENNIVRGAYYALASALSGTQTMALCSYDEAYSIPSEKAALISLRTMQILADEMGLCDTVDPLAGSYYIESLTAEMEKKIIEHMKEVESAGGVVRCVEEGVIQKKVARQAYEHELALERGEFVKVAVNKYVTESGEHGAKSEEQRAKSEEQRAKSEEQGARSGEQGAASRAGACPP
ncbi:MAG: methylmalonyl-CoA mutase family protein, partial [Planctomycetota bacterium]|nr:methylmalonyl-CoA mutase family protein [Planctomycetota bacterium]